MTQFIIIIEKSTCSCQMRNWMEKIGFVFDLCRHRCILYKPRDQPLRGAIIAMSYFITISNYLVKTRFTRNKYNIDHIIWSFYFKTINISLMISSLFHALSAINIWKMQMDANRKCVHNFRKDGLYQCVFDNHFRKIKWFKVSDVQ